MVEYTPLQITALCIPQDELEAAASRVDVWATQLQTGYFEDQDSLYFVYYEMPEPLEPRLAVLRGLQERMTALVEGIDDHSGIFSDAIKEEYPYYVEDFYDNPEFADVIGFWHRFPLRHDSDLRESAQYINAWATAVLPVKDELPANLQELLQALVGIDTEVDELIDALDAALCTTTGGGFNAEMR